MHRRLWARDATGRRQPRGEYGQRTENKRPRALRRRPHRGCSHSRHRLPDSRDVERTDGRHLRGQRGHRYRVAQPAPCPGTVARSGRRPDHPRDRHTCPRRPLRGGRRLHGRGHRTPRPPRIHSQPALPEGIGSHLHEAQCRVLSRERPDRARLRTRPAETSLPHDRAHAPGRSGVHLRARWGAIRGTQHARRRRLRRSGRLAAGPGDSLHR